MRPFGPILACNRRLHAIRVLPLVRANGILVIVLLTVAIVAAGEVWDAARSSDRPEPITLDRVLGPQTISNPYVEIEGLVFPANNLAYPRRGSRRPSAFVYVPMLEKATERVLLIRFPGDFQNGEPRELIVSGMLEPPDAGVARQLDALGWRLAGLPVEQRYILLAGITPKPIWLLAGITCLAGGLAALFVVAMFISSKNPNAFSSDSHGTVGQTPTDRTVESFETTDPNHSDLPPPEPPTP